MYNRKKPSYNMPIMVSQYVVQINRFRRNVSKWWVLFLMMLPGIVYYIIFRYGPMYGVIIAFKDYRILDGMAASPWVGFKHFNALFKSPMFGRIIRNTLVISFLKLCIGFPPPIILALLLNELRIPRLKKIIQTVTYLPHFLSWVIISGILIALFSPGDGLVNNWLKLAGQTPISFLTEKYWFVAVLVFSEIWKEVGWGAIIYLAALSGINPELYEAATIDGATRGQQILHVSLPSIIPVIILMFILRLGRILDAGFEQIYILYSPQVYEVSDIIDTWVFRNGIEQFRFSVATATGLFKSAIGLVLIVGSNKLIKTLTGNGIW
jgi:putative aldouronate transport system permease protein